MEKVHEHYDVVVVGGGAAGLTAGLYTGRANLKTLIIEKALVGGLATDTSEIANYPGFPEVVSGGELMNRFKKQAEKFGVKFKLTDVKKVNLLSEDKTIETFRNVFHAPTVVLASGGRPRLTKAPGEENFLFGKGVSFCATCDAAYYTGKHVMIVGSGDAALEEGAFLTRFADRATVSVVHNEGVLDANKIAQAQALANPKLTFKWNTVVDSFVGGEKLDTVVLRNTKTGELDPIKVDGCFLFIGYEPNTELFKGQIDLTDDGYILTNEQMQTAIPGVFAAGDVRWKCLKQIATAVGDGAIAGVGAEKYLADMEILRSQILQKDKLGVVYIWTPIDQTCVAGLKVLEDIEADMPDQIRVGTIDVYKNVNLARKIGCTEAGSIVYIKDGKPARVERMSDRETLLQQIAELCR